MKTLHKFVVATAAITAVALPLSAVAQDGSFSFKVAGGVDKAQATINKQIEKTLEDYSWVFAKVAGPRLEETNQACKTIDFDVKGEELTYTCTYKSGKVLKVSTPTDGKLHNAKGSDGTPYKIKQTMKTAGDKTTIVQFWKGEDGAKENTFIYDPGAKTLKLKVKITSGKLDKGPFRYSLNYKQN